VGKNLPTGRYQLGLLTNVDITLEADLLLNHAVGARALDNQILTSGTAE